MIKSSAQTEFRIETKLPRGLVASVFFKVPSPGFTVMGSVFPVGAIHHTAEILVRMYQKSHEEDPLWLSTQPNYSAWRRIASLKVTIEKQQFIGI